MKVLPGPGLPDRRRSSWAARASATPTTTGRGSLKVRGKAHIEQTSTGRTRIIITEIPYQVNKSKLVTQDRRPRAREEAHRDLGPARRVRPQGHARRHRAQAGAASRRSCSTSSTSTRSSRPASASSCWRSSTACRARCTLRQMLHHYIEHQKEVITRRTQYELRQGRGARPHPRGLRHRARQHRRGHQDHPRVATTTPRPRPSLIERFGLSEAQTDAILEMRLRRLTGLERHKIEEELAELREKIAWFKKVLGDVNLVLQIIKDELGEIRHKFANKRRTEIAAAAKDLDVEDLIAEEDMVVTITKAGYVKRLPVATYRQQKRGGKGLAGREPARERLRRAPLHRSHPRLRALLLDQGQGLPHEGARAAGRLAPRARHGGRQPAAVRAGREDRRGHHDARVLAGRVPAVRHEARHGEEDGDPGVRPQSRRDGIIAINLRDDDELDLGAPRDDRARRS